VENDAAGRWANPTLAAKTKTRRGWGTRGVEETGAAGALGSPHPSRKNKDAARVGHPGCGGERGAGAFVSKRKGKADGRAAAKGSNSRSSWEPRVYDRQR